MAHVRTLLGALAGVALVGVITLTAIEIVPRVQDIRGGAPGGAPAPNDDLAELAARLISPPFALPDGSTQTTRLHPGALPSNAGFDMPIPPGARIIGSAVRQRSGANTSFDVVLDVNGKPDDVTAFYERELAKKGLTTPSAAPQPQSGGFVSSAGPSSSKMFCTGDALPYVTITVFPRPNAPNDVRAHYEPAQPAGTAFVGSPCSKTAGPGGIPQSRLPTLRAPDGIFLQSTGGGGGSGRSQSDAVATTSKSAAELEAFFAQQLAAAGWTRVSGAANAPLAFSTWKVPGDGDWTGLLIVIEMPTKDRRSLLLRAESPTGF
jgi:hypothetical protein